MNSDRDEIYTKIVAFDDIYNFVIQSFFIWSHLRTQKVDIRSRSQFRVSRIVYRRLEYEDDFKWKKFELQIVDLVESYNFRINCIFIRVHTKKL
jgi:hypothetical protein